MKKLFKGFLSFMAFPAFYWLARGFHPLDFSIWTDWVAIGSIVVFFLFFLGKMFSNTK